MLEIHIFNDKQCIQITDLDLHTLQRQGMLCSAREGLRFYIYSFNPLVSFNSHYKPLKTVWPWSSWTCISPAFVNSVAPDQLASSSGSALFVITYVFVSTTWIYWLTFRSGRGILIYSAWQGHFSPLLRWWWSCVSTTPNINVRILEVVMVFRFYGPFSNISVTYIVLALLPFSCIDTDLIFTDLPCIYGTAPPPPPPPCPILCQTQNVTDSLLLKSILGRYQPDRIKAKC